VLATFSTNLAFIVLFRLRAKKRANPKAGPTLTLGGVKD